MAEWGKVVAVSEKVTRPIKQVSLDPVRLVLIATRDSFDLEENEKGRASLSRWVVSEDKNLDPLAEDLKEYSRTWTKFSPSPPPTVFYCVLGISGNSNFKRRSSQLQNYE